MKAFVTGIAGFAGSHLSDLLLEQGHEVSGIFLPDTSTQNLAHIRGRIDLHAADLLQPEAVFPILRDFSPDWIFHLAGKSSVAESWKDPAGAFSVNTLGGIHLLEAIRKLPRRPRLMAVTSAEIYGNPPGGSPITEETPFAPENPYAASKLAFDLVCGQYAGEFELDLIRLRPMNHIGPRQAPGFAIPAFARQIAEIEAGKREPVIRVGNLESWRDFTDARDVVRAYLLTAERGKSGNGYLVCSGVSRKIGDILAHLLSLSSIPIRIEEDSALLRPADARRAEGSFEKLARETGWGPQIPLEQTLADVLGSWRKSAP
ncbi:MAG: GDP-mannose 4,6-dehydratase [bacterium]|nr:GDP-mannose 4,6-dehydratase [bacterium]